MKIIIETIPHSEQKYPTVGDYWVDADGTWQIRVSKMGDWKYEFLVAFHELCEKALCTERGITDEGITEFDKIFELNRKEGNTDEPGNDKDAPYRLEHNIATFIESGMAQALGVDWNKYDETVNNL